MNPEGQIHIQLVWDGGAIRSVAITPRGLADAARLLNGKTPAQAGAIVPLLFSLCGRAQGVAAALALDAAQGALGVAPSQERAVLSEAFQESAWRFLVDLPQRYGLAPEVQALAALRKLCGGDLPGGQLAGQLDQFLAQHLFGCPPRQWRERAAHGDAWLADAPQPFATVMQKLHAEGGWGAKNISLLRDFDTGEMVEKLLPALLGQADFARYPTWCGEPAETGVLARSETDYGGSVSARFAARLDELAGLAEALRDSDALPAKPWCRHALVAENAGLAWVQTARGLLLHYARVENGAVADYRIVAPTEWNFHPQGAYARGLIGKAAESPAAARRDAELLLLALDPCVDAVLSV